MSIQFLNILYNGAFNVHNNIVPKAGRNSRFNPLSKTPILIVKRTFQPIICK